MLVQQVASSGVTHAPVSEIGSQLKVEAGLVTVTAANQTAGAALLGVGADCRCSDWRCGKE